jgi:hypothetical protein
LLNDRLKGIRTPKAINPVTGSKLIGLLTQAVLNDIGTERIAVGCSG